MADGETPVIGIYSFPKSGNTWMRHIIAAAAGRSLVDAAPDIYKDKLFESRIRIGNVVRYFYKSHRHQEQTSFKRLQFENAGLIYLLRHPLDVFLSQLNYLSRNVAESDRFQIPCDSVESVIANGDLDIFFSTFLALGSLRPGFKEAGSWFESAAWWTRQAATDRRIAIVRYEALKTDPQGALAPAAAVIGVDLETLMKGYAGAGQETQIDGKFFWKQTSGHYRDYIPEAMIARFAKHHGAFVRSLGYSLDG